LARAFGAFLAKIDVEQQLGHGVHLAPKLPKLSVAVSLGSEAEEAFEFLSFVHGLQHADEQSHATDGSECCFGSNGQPSTYIRGFRGWKMGYTSGMGQWLMQQSLTVQAILAAVQAATAVVLSINFTD
jgi:hypothetical protein